jgi:hypothetical protein
VHPEPILTVAQAGTIALWLGVVFGVLEILYGAHLWRSEASRGDGIGANANLPFQGQYFVCSGLMLVLLTGNYLLRGTMPETILITLFFTGIVATLWWQFRLSRQMKRWRATLTKLQVPAEE